MFLEFYVFGKRVIVWVRGGVRNISSPLRGGVLNNFRRFWGGVPNFMVEVWNTLHPPPPQVHILYDRSLILKNSQRRQLEMSITSVFQRLSFFQRRSFLKHPQIKRRSIDFNFVLAIYSYTQICPRVP